MVNGYNLKFTINTLLGLTIAACLMTLTATNVEAGRGGYRWITTESEFDFRTVSAPIRPGRNGDEVRLPGGTWMACEYSCEYTLRSNTVDFFLCGDGADDSCSPGVFGDIIARFRD